MEVVRELLTSPSRRHVGENNQRQDRTAPPDAAAGIAQRARPVRQHRGRAGRGGRLAQGTTPAGRTSPCPWASPQPGSPPPLRASWTCRYRPSSHGRPSLGSPAAARTPPPGRHWPCRQLIVSQPTGRRWSWTAWCPSSGNLWLAGQQIWLGPAMTGRTIRLWAGLDRVHVLLDGYRVMTLPSRLDARDLARLAAAGARQAGPPPLPTASGDVIEVERTVNASGNVSLGNHMISAGLPLAGQRVTLRLDGPAPTSCPAAYWPAPSPAPSRSRSGPGCAGHALDQPSRPGCPSRCWSSGGYPCAGRS